jgi:3-dehydroquinate synthase
VNQAPARRRRFNLGGLAQNAGRDAFQDLLITGPVPPLAAVLEEFSALRPEPSPAGVLVVCDRNTLPLARPLGTPEQSPFCVLEPGESRKDLAAVEQILRAAHDAGLGRDSLFIACGGGVVSDLAGFAASVYMRGVGLCVVSTSLLGMVDASVGGKTGFDLFGVKNLAGSFYPARLVYLPLDSLATLPPAEWKSGMAELIKTAILDGEALFRLLEAGPRETGPFIAGPDALRDAITRAVACKGRIVEADPRESGGGRILLNLGHSFGHALESSAGLGRISHGEAVAWGIARSCELGQSLGLTPAPRARRILGLLKNYGYETAAPHPLMGDPARFMAALGRDKKNRRGKAVFVVPAAEGAAAVEVPDGELLRKICGTPPETDAPRRGA